MIDFSYASDDKVIAKNALSWVYSKENSTCIIATSTGEHLERVWRELIALADKSVMVQNGSRRLAMKGSEYTWGINGLVTNPDTSEQFAGFFGDGLMVVLVEQDNILVPQSILRTIEGSMSCMRNSCLLRCRKSKEKATK